MLSQKSLRECISTVFGEIPRTCRIAMGLARNVIPMGTHTHLSCTASSPYRRRARPETTAGRLDRAPRADPREHLLDERDRDVARGPRRHDLAVVRGDLARESGHRARDLGLGDECHDADLSEAAVVELDQQAALLLLGSLVLREAKRVEQVERGVADLVANGGERRELARLTTFHVVLVASALAPQLEAGDQEEDLPLGVGWDRIPLGGRAAGGRDVGVRGAIEGRGPREVDTVGLNAVADERGHRHAAVLNFGLAKPADGLRLRNAHQAVAAS
mmetsp:Transcript_9772/g.25223  ORF Transcript_9772/g.25223 Transcript_9772/m.25223 type:complete len:275 (-) Transcript_9772:236-1060(-)